MDFRAVGRALAAIRLPQIDLGRSPGSLGRTVRWVIAGLAILWISLEARVWLSIADDIIRSFRSNDYVLYMDATRRWLAGGSFYESYQLAGPYDVQIGSILYPPYAIPFFIPFLVLPALVWWLPPVLIVAWVIVRHRPGPWSRLALLLLATDTTTWALIVKGNPVMWITAFVALGTLGLGTGALVLLKPSVLPFALVGVESRRWWLWLALLVVLGLVTLPLEAEYLAVLRNGRGLAAWYSLTNVPMLLMPLVAWAGRSRQRSAAVLLDGRQGRPRLTKPRMRSNQRPDKANSEHDGHDSRDE